MQKKTPQQRTLFKGGTVLTLDVSIGDFTLADVLVEGSRITAVGPNLSADDARVIDATCNIVMPGFVNRPSKHGSVCFVGCCLTSRRWMSTLMRFRLRSGVTTARRTCTWLPC